MKKFETAAALVAAVESLPLVRQYLLSEPLVKADERRAGQTFTTSGERWANEAAADRELRQVAAFVKVGKNAAGRPSTIVCFAASPEVVEGAIAELARRVREAEEAERAAVRAKEEAERAAARQAAEKKLRDREAAVAGLLEEFPELGIRVEAQRVRVVNAEERPLFGIHNTDLGYGKTGVIPLDEIRGMLETERRVREYRAAALPRVAALDERYCQLVGEGSPVWGNGTRPLHIHGWGRELDTYRRAHAERREVLSLSHSMEWREGRETEEISWTPEGIGRLEILFKKKIESLEEKGEAAWRRLRALPLAGAMVARGDLYDFRKRRVYRDDAGGRILWVHPQDVTLCAEEDAIRFASEEEAGHALDWALAHGAHLPGTPDALPPEWREEARKEGWDELKVECVLAILRGEALWQSSRQGSSTRSTFSGPRISYSTTTSWSLGRLRVASVVREGSRATDEYESQVLDFVHEIARRVGAQLDPEARMKETLTRLALSRRWRLNVEVSRRSRYGGDVSEFREGSLEEIYPALLSWARRLPGVEGIGSRTAIFSFTDKETGERFSSKAFDSGFWARTEDGKSVPPEDAPGLGLVLGRALYKAGEYDRKPLHSFRLQVEEEVRLWPPKK